MVPAYMLTVDITAKDIAISETEFRESIAPCLTYLSALKGAFDKKPCDDPDVHQDDCSKLWSARFVLLISVGKERGQFLSQLYHAIFRLIAFELPCFDVRADASRWNF